MRRLLIPAILACALGCERREASQSSPFQREEAEHVLLIAVDLSGSFCEHMTVDGKAYQFILRAVESSFRQRVGSSDQVILTQLSGNSTPLLWQGTPRELIEQFPDPGAFREFLLSHAEPSSSRIHDGIAESLEYAAERVDMRNARMVALVLSDCQDNKSGPRSDERLVRALQSISGRGSVGFYYCDQEQMPSVRNLLRQAGVTRYVVEGGFRDQPPLPQFE